MDGNKVSFFPSNKPFFAAAVAACAIACAASAGLAQKGTTMIAIEKMDIGRPPAGFEFARTGQGGPGQWVVVSDPAATGGQAIEQASTGPDRLSLPARDLYTALGQERRGGRSFQVGGRQGRSGRWHCHASDRLRQLLRRPRQRA